MSAASGRPAASGCRPECPSGRRRRHTGRRYARRSARPVAIFLPAVSRALRQADRIRTPRRAGVGRRARLAHYLGRRNFYPSHSYDTRMYATQSYHCLLYTSDAADDLLCVDLGGRGIIKKKKKKTISIILII